MDKTALCMYKDFQNCDLNAPIFIHCHHSGEDPLGGGHASSSYPLSDLSEGGGVGRPSAESVDAMRKHSAWLLQGNGGGLPSLL